MVTFIFGRQTWQRLQLKSNFRTRYLGIRKTNTFWVENENVIRKEETKREVYLPR